MLIIHIFTFMINVEYSNMMIVVEELMMIIVEELMMTVYNILPFI